MAWSCCTISNERWRLYCEQTLFHPSLSLITYTNFTLLKQRTPLLARDNAFHQRFQEVSSGNMVSCPLLIVAYNSPSCGHYWGLSGLLLAIPLYGPWYGLSALRGSVQAKDEFLFPLASVYLVGFHLPHRILMLHILTQLLNLIILYTHSSPKSPISFAISSLGA